MLKYTKLHIRPSELFEFEETVPNWEVPILEAVHGTNGGCTILETDILVDKRAPDPTDEYQRLHNRYKFTEKEDGSRGLAYVAAVYGEFGLGQRKIADAIKAAYVEGELPPAPRVDLVGAQASSVGG